MISCEVRKYDTEIHKYEVLSILLNELTRVIPSPSFNPPQKKEGLSLNYFSKKDSLKIVEFNINKINSKQIVAILPELETSVLRKIKLNSNCFQQFSGLLDDFFKMKNANERIDISKIKSNRKDSIMYFKKEYLSMHSKGFDAFDILLSFSQIKFNKKLDKAIIIAAKSTSKLSGFNAIYFLERKNGVWHIKCQKGLTIS